MSISENNKLDFIHKFTIGDDHFLFLPRRFSIFKIDQCAWDLLASLSGDSPGMDSIRDMYGNEQIDGLETEFRKLNIIIDTPKPLPEPKHTDEVDLSYLVLDISSACNLRCKYCSAPIEIDQSQLMSREVARSAVDFILEKSKNCSVSFFGGEPFMNFKTMKSVVEYGESKAEKHGAKINWSVTTNGTIINDEITEFLSDHCISVVCSIDGDREAHNSARIFSNGKGSYDRVRTNAEKLLSSNLPSITARATISIHNLDIDKVVTHLHKIGFSHITSAFASQIDYSGNEPYARLLTNEEIERYRNGLIRTVDYIIDSMDRGKPVWVIDLVHYARMLHYLRPRHSACGAGKIMIAVAPDGGMYPCSRFSGMREYAIGDIVSGLQRAAPFDGDTASRKECDSCWARYLCGGGCWADRLLSGNREYSQLYCRLWKYKLEAAMWLYHKLKQFPNEIIDSYFRQVSDQVEYAIPG